MSFYSENKNFIRQRLIVDMKHLSLEEKMRRYGELRPEVVKRLKNSYSSTNDKIQFYKDAIEYLGDYDLEYLIKNLILEKENILIVNSIEVAKGVKFNSRFVTSFYYSFLKSVNVKPNVAFEAFLHQSINHFLTIDHSALYQTRKYGFIRKLSSYFEENLSKNYFIDDELDEIYFIFITFWNYVYRFGFDDSKAIFLYSHINNIVSNLSTTHKVQFYNFSLTTKSKLTDYFARNSKLFLPFVMEYDYYTRDGFKANQNVYFEKIFKFEKFKKLDNSSTLELLKESENTEDSVLELYIKNLYKQQLLRFQLPDENEIDFLLNSSIKDKKYFLKMLYMY
jgi:hypothetical protein